jgi:hypothetical protein
VDRGKRISESRCASDGAETRSPRSELVVELNARYVLDLVGLSGGKSCFQVEKCQSIGG